MFGTFHQSPDIKKIFKKILILAFEVTLHFFLEILTHGWGWRWVILRFSTWEFDHWRWSILLIKNFWLQMSYKISHMSLSITWSEPLKAFVTILRCGIFWGVFRHVLWQVNYVFFVNLNGFNLDFNFIFIEWLSNK